MRLFLRLVFFSESSKMLGTTSIRRDNEKTGFGGLLRELKAGELKAEESTVVTPDGAELNTLTLSPPRPADNPQDRVYIIKFTGNSGYFEKTSPEGQFNILREAAAEVQDKNCHYVVFNYRGVGKSSGSANTHHDLMTDVLAQVDWLVREKKADPRKIFFKSHSLGAAISTVSAKELHDLHFPVKEYNGRSFGLSSDVKAGKGWLWPFKKALYKLVLVLTGWEIDAATAMKGLPESDRDYFCVRSSKAEREANRQQLQRLPELDRPGSELMDDETIPHRASIHRALKVERLQLKRSLEAKGLGHGEVKRQVKEESNRHKMRGIPGKNGHDVPASELLSRQAPPGLRFTAQDHFNAFFKRSNPAYIPPQPQKEAELKSPELFRL